jgi:hypothetical protein
MTDYSSYRDHVGITNPEMTKALHSVYRGFGRPAASFVNNPERSGVCLLPEAEVFLVNKFGPGPGLASLEFVPEALEANPPKKHRPDRRRKACRITFRMDEDTYKQAIQLKESAGALSMQELFEILLKDAIKRWEAEE